MELSWIWLPLIACLILTGIHAWLGIHVLSRGVIFVDLALAQIAALGAMIGLAVGLEPGTSGSYVFALGFTIMGAGVLALSRTKKGNIPQEAIIGIVYAVASAAGVVITSHTADVHGVEKIQGILLGRSIVWVSGAVVIKTAIVYSVVALVHLVFYRQFLLISQDVEAARARGMRIVLWDFLFYSSFGVVITSSVQIAGVLLVFCFLIVPGVMGAMWTRRIRYRLWIGWGTGLVASVIGLFLSFDSPSGPVIVVVFGSILLLSAVVHRIRFAESRPRALRQILGVASMGGLLVVLILWVPWPDLLGGHPAESIAQGKITAAASGGDSLRRLASADSLVREAALANIVAHPDPSQDKGLFAAFRRESDPDLKIHMAAEGLRRHGRGFLPGLVRFVIAVESPLYFDEGLHLVARYTEFVRGDAGADADATREVLRAWWKKHGGQLRWDESKHRFLIHR